MPEPVDRGPEELDPTGIRDLLAALPDPGPMPDDLVARIEARLEEEQAARVQAPPPAPDRPAASVVPLSAGRDRRRPGRTLLWLGAAAAGVVVTAAVVPQLLDGIGTNGADTAAYYPTRGGETGSAADLDMGASEDDAGPQDDAAGDDADTHADGPAPKSSQEDAEGAEGAGEDETTADGGPAMPLLPLDGELVLLPDLDLVEQEMLTLTLLAAVDQHDHGRGEPPGRPERLTEDEATSCWRTLAATHSFDRYAAAPAQYVRPEGQRQGDPVVALLGVDDEGSARSWIMPQSCTSDPDVAPIGEGEPLD